MTTTLDQPVPPWPWRWLAGAMSPRAIPRDRTQMVLMQRLLVTRYLALCVAVAVFLGLTTANRLWLSDFWELVAAVRELATHPLNPRHPLMQVVGPSVLYTPYSLLSGVVARLTGASSEQVLTIAAVANLVLLLVSFRLFVGIVAPRLRDAVAFHALLFMLLLWGANAWLWAGFLHLEAIWAVLPYPSTFAIGLSFLAVYLFHTALQRSNVRLTGVVGLLLAVVVTSHPTSFLFACAAVVGMTVTSARPFARGTLCMVLTAFAVPFVVALVWPYYPVARLLTGIGPRDIANDASIALYTNILERVWPALPGAALVFLEVRRRLTRWLAVTFTLLLLVYIFGRVSNEVEFGGVLFFLVLLAQVGLALNLARLERVWLVDPSRWLIATALLLAVWTGVAVHWHRSTLAMAIPDRPKRLIEPYESLGSVVGQYDTVLADMHVGWEVPAVAGKIVAWEHAQDFVPDAQTRREDTQRFFDPAATCQARASILDKYNVQYVLLSRSVNSPEVVASVERFGLPRQDFDELRLLRVGDPQALCAGGGT